MAEKLIGKVTHYYDKLGVAIIELAGKLKVGDRVKFKKGEEELEQEVTSMQIEREQIETAKKGDIIGLKVDQEIKEKTEVYLM